MNKTTLLRVLVLADLMLAFTALGADLFFGWTLPAGLASFVHDRVGMHGWSNLPHIVLLLVCSTCAFASWIGLALLRPFARPLYLVAWALFLLFVVVRGPSVSTSIGMMVRLVHAMVGGLIVGLVYFSELARRFEHTPATAPGALGFGTDRA